MTRRHDLDWVRVLAFALLVVYHVGMYYVSWDWHVKSHFAGPAAEPFMLLSAPWRLSLLFVVSGAASAFLMDKLRAGFLGVRSLRLLPPLIFGMLVVVPPQSYFEVVEKLGYAGGYLSFWGRYLQADGSFCRDGDCLILPTWNHLWFVSYLWVYTLVLALVVGVAPRLRASLTRGLEALLRGCGLLLWPAVALGLARLMLLDRFGSTHALIDDGYNHAQYFAVFALGFLIAHSTPVWAGVERLRWPALLLALAAWAALIAYFISFADTAPPDALRGAMRLVWGLNQWSAIVAILGFARRWAPRDSRLLRYLVPAVFPVYILHQTVIVVAAHGLQPLALHPGLEAPLLMALTFAVCLAAYEGIRRVYLLRPLFGLPAASRRRDGSAVRPQPAP